MATAPTRPSQRMKLFTPALPSTQVQIGIELLKIEFTKAFDIHQEYRKTLADLIRLSIAILSLPVLIAAALVGANLIGKTPSVNDLLGIEVISYAMLISGALNFAVVRLFVSTDRVKNEAKHHVNRLRGLYLMYLKDLLPPGWAPFWGATNAYLDRRARMRGPDIAVGFFTLLNAIYLEHGLAFLLRMFAAYQLFWWSHIALILLIWALQQEFIVYAMHRTSDWIRMQSMSRK